MRLIDLAGWRLCWPCGNRTTLSYSTDRFFRVVFFGVVLRCRFGWVGALAVGSSISAGVTSASGSGNAGPLRACAWTNRGAFSHGHVSWTTCRRRAVVARAESGWACGIPCFVRYERSYNPCSLRWRDNCLNDCPHSRQITACLVMRLRQSTGCVSEIGTVMVVPISSCALSALRVACVFSSVSCTLSGSTYPVSISANANSFANSTNDYGVAGTSSKHFCAYLTH